MTNSQFNRLYDHAKALQKEHGQDACTVCSKCGAFSAWLNEVTRDYIGRRCTGCEAETAEANP